MMKLIATTALVFATTNLFAATPGMISVSGECLRSVSPDRGRITLQATSLTKSASESHQKATALYETVRAEVKKMNLKDSEMQTTQYSVQEKKVWENNKEVSKGFEAIIGLQVTTSEIGKLGDVMSTASKKGITSVGSLETFLSPEKTRTEYNLCLEEAIKNAKSKADRMAKAAGANVGDVSSIEETAHANPQPQPVFGGRNMKMLSASSESSDAPGIEAKDDTLSVSINVQYKIK